MTENNGWGGKREGAGSGGKRDGAGRPRTKWNSGGSGKRWIAEISKPGDFPTTAIWRILDVGEDYIEFQNETTEEIIVLRQDD